jgi:uncharacterized protein YndB with AHSA1/START domain
LTEPDQLGKWFPSSVVVHEWRVGARLEFKPGHGLADFDGEVLAYQPPSLLEIRWGTDVIRFEVAPDGRGSILTLVDTIDELGKAARDSAGWHICLDGLQRALDGTAAPSSTDQWAGLDDAYAKKFGPEAATIGPPEGWTAEA